MTKHFVRPDGSRIEVVDADDRIAPASRHSAMASYTKSKPQKERYIGCPIWWLQLVRPVVHSKDQLVVAIYLWRRRVVCGNAALSVPNGELQAWGISRQTKYKTLKRLAAVGLIRIVRRSAKAALEVTILAEKPKRK